MRPLIFGRMEVFDARRQNSPFVVSGNEATTACWRLHQRADARRSPTEFCNAGVNFGEGQSQGGRAANQWVLPHRCQLKIVKKLTIFEVISTGRNLDNRATDAYVRRVDGD